MTAVTSIPQAAPQTDYSAPKTAQKAEEATDASNFIALLNIGSVTAQDSPQPAPANDLPPRNTAPSPRDDASVPSPTDTRDTHPAPAPTRDAAPAPRDQNDAPPAPRDVPQPRPRDAAPAKDAAPARPADNVAKPTDSKSTAQDDSSKPASTDTAKDAASTQDKAEDLADIAARQKKIRSQLNDQLSGIGQILQSIIDALSGAKDATTGTVTAATSLTPAAATDTTATDAKTATPAATALVPAAQPLTGLAALLATLTPVTGAQTPATAATTGKIEIPASLLTSDDKQTDIDLLKDIQSLLQKMQDSLKAVDNDTPLSTAPTTAAAKVSVQTTGPALTGATTPVANLQTIVENVQLDVSALEVRITQNTAPATTDKDKDAPLPTASATPAASTDVQTDTVKPQNILAFLKDNIAQIRDQLHALQSDNEAAFAQAKTTLQQQFEAARSSFKDVSAAPVIAADTKAATDAVVATAAPAANTTLTANATLQGPAFIAPTPVTIAIAQTPADTNTGGGNQQQGQNQQNNQSAPPIASAQSLSTGSARTEAPSFTRSLGKSQAAPLAEQVAVQVKNAVTDGTSKIRIQLDPADLGKMDIKLTVDANGKTGVSILVDNKSTLDLLQRDASTLTRALNDAGLSADGSSLSFNLRGGQQEGHGQQQAATTYKKAQPEEEEIPMANAVARNYVVNLADGLDIKA